MMRFWRICLFIGCVIGTVSAQNQSEPPAEDEVVAKPDAEPRQEEPPMPTGAEAGRMRMHWALQRVIEELNLDERQRAKFEEIAARHEDDMLDLEEKWREIREAQRGGDKEKADRLRAEMRDQRGPESGMTLLLDELEPDLNDEQIARLWDMQDQMERRRADRERYQWLMTDLPEELGLDLGQKEHYKKLLEAERNKMFDNVSQQRPLMEQISEARAAGDLEKARELQRRLEESMPKREDMIDRFLNQLPKILNDEQNAVLESVRAGLEKPTAEAKENESGVLDAREVLRAAQRIRFEGDWRDRLKEIQRDAVAAYRKIPRKDREAHVKLGEEVKAKIVALCDENQKQEFETALQRLERRRSPENKP